MTFLAVLVVAPLVLMLLFSLLASPIYVVARYDTLVFPSMLGLLGFAGWRLQEWMNRRVGLRVAGALVAFPPLLVALTIFPAKFKPVPAGVNLHPQQTRGEILRDYLRPGDTIVCLGLEGVKVSYQLLRQGIKAEMLTFPLETGRHLGYFLPREVVKDPEALRADAREIVARFERGGPGRRLWVALDPYSFRPAAPGSLEADYTLISSILLETLAARGLREWQHPALMARARKLGLRVYE